MSLSLSDAIKHCEKVAEENEKQAKLWESGANYLHGVQIKYSKCLECASEHRQLAEWLRELKGYRKAHEEIKHEPLVWEYGQAIEKCLWIIDNCLKEVNNADSD